jgi:hypothetical protein
VPKYTWPKLNNCVQQTPPTHKNHSIKCILLLQVKAFEADVVEAQGYKGAIEAADELRGLLEGSKAVGTRKGLSNQQQAAYSSLPQVCRCVEFFWGLSEGCEVMW